MTITYKMAAFSAAAGKYNPDAPFQGNEDNFYYDSDLTDDKPGHFTTDEVTEMNECGVIMAVADGMGGMNAGEVASAIAVETIEKFFAPGKVNAQIASSKEERRKYLENLIKEADSAIKADSKANKDHADMGSTIILAWIVGDEVTVSWLGDSRAYRFNPATGIEMLSEDHSYVQDLVRKGIITYEDTFEHPNGNIVTRSLGDFANSPKPETRDYKLHNDDIILLCSDGLSGVLRDKKTFDPNGNLYPGENLEDIIAANTHSMKACREELFAAAERADWYDNVTALLLQITGGIVSNPALSKTLDPTDSKKPVEQKTEEEPSAASSSDGKPESVPFWQRSLHIKRKTAVSLIGAALALLLVGVVTFMLLHQKQATPVVKEAVEQPKDMDSTDNATPAVEAAPQQDVPVTTTQVINKNVVKTIAVKTVGDSPSTSTEDDNDLEPLKKKNDQMVSVPKGAEVKTGNSQTEVPKTKMRRVLY